MTKTYALFLSKGHALEQLLMQINLIEANGLFFFLLFTNFPTINLLRLCKYDVIYSLLQPSCLILTYQQFNMFIHNVCSLFQNYAKIVEFLNSNNSLTKLSWFIFLSFCRCIDFFPKKCFCDEWDINLWASLLNVFNYCLQKARVVQAKDKIEK